jgi:hypothetical protein
LHFACFNAPLTPLVHDKHWNPIGLNEICLVKANLEEKEHETWREITGREREHLELYLSFSQKRRLLW